MISQEEVEEIVNNSEEVRKADETFRKLYKQLQKSEDNVYDLKYRMEKIQGKIDGTKYKTLMTMIDDEMRWLTDFPKVACEEYQARRRALRRRCWPVLIRNFSF
ncbi:unnamed protein product [Caenorhabditis auriculariae]|uniref:Uncharacterized protein n=1 Tax=Caenorhabditis auriculariae TaxID=2777116 RepID=A0A8S1HKU3_9PELO|nr:unnamed protein product [Caenorhabditis auriculariae]